MSDVHQSFLSGLLVTFQRGAVSSHPESLVQTPRQEQCLCRRANTGSLLRQALKPHCHHTQTVLKHVSELRLCGTRSITSSDEELSFLQTPSPTIRQPFPLCLQELLPVVSLLAANILLCVTTPSREFFFFFF